MEIYKYSHQITTCIYSSTGTAFTVVGIQISASLGVISTVSTRVGGILLLTSRKYKKKLLRCCELA